MTFGLEGTDLRRTYLMPADYVHVFIIIVIIIIMTFGEYSAGGLDEGLLPIGAICAFCYPGAGC